MSKETRQAKEKRPGPNGTERSRTPCQAGAAKRDALPVSAECGQPGTYLTYPPSPRGSGFTVTDSQGISPYSVCRLRGGGWRIILFVFTVAQNLPSVKGVFLKAGTARTIQNAPFR